MSKGLEQDKSATGNSKENPGTWEHGWYVFEDGQVTGPHAAKDALGREKSENSQTARMVSRKGFTQWYPVRDFAEIYAMIESYSTRLDEKHTTPKSTSSAFEPKGKVINTKSSDLNEKNRRSLTTDKAFDLATGDLDQNKTNSKDLNSDVASLFSIEAQGPESDAGTPAITTQELSSASQAAVSDQTLEPKENKKLKKMLRRQVRQAQAAARNQKLMEPKLFADSYFELQNRLRLGRVFSPTLGAFIYTPLTLGGYWWDWFVRACDEVNWHLSGSTKTNLGLPLWLCMIPGVHLILAYDLARAVSLMEMQNGYRSTRPWLALVAALFPPLYIVLIQSALNKHWRLHVYHSQGAK